MNLPPSREQKRRFWRTSPSTTSTTTNFRPAIRSLLASCLAGIVAVASGGHQFVGVDLFGDRKSTYPVITGGQ